MPTERRVRRDPRERLQRPLPTVSHIEAAAAARVSALTSLPDAYLGPILTLSSPLPASVLASSSSPCLISLVYCFPIFGNRCFNSILSAPRSSFNFVMNVTFFTSATPVSLLSVPASAWRPRSRGTRALATQPASTDHYIFVSHPYMNAGASFTFTARRRYNVT